MESTSFYLFPWWGHACPFTLALAECWLLLWCSFSAACATTAQRTAAVIQRPTTSETLALLPKSFARLLQYYYSAAASTLLQCKGQWLAELLLLLAGATIRRGRSGNGAAKNSHKKGREKRGRWPLLPRGFYRHRQDIKNGQEIVKKMTRPE